MGYSDPADLDKLLKVRKGTWAKMEAGEIKVSGGVAGALNRLLQVNLSWLLEGEGEMLETGKSAEEVGRSLALVDPGVNHLIIPDWTPPGLDQFDLVPMAEAHLSAGGGAFVLSEGEGAIHAFRKSWLRRTATSPNNVVLMEVRGDSMEPVIVDGDVVMVDKGRRRIYDGYIYALGVGETIMIKRLYWLPDGRVRIRSDNPEFDSDEARPEDIRVLGQVIWRAGQPAPARRR